MARDGIKIVEFDRDGDGPPAARSDANTGMKIIEFDNDREDGRKTVASAQDLGPVKIVEFDDDGPAERPPSASGAPQAAAKPIKIRDFGAEAETAGKGASGGGRHIKIMEFD